MSESQNTKKSSKKAASGLFIPAGLFMGMGIGLAVDGMIPGMYIGLGVGFLLFACVLVFARD
ncbi:MAG: hypothetical protein WC333_07930 [Dehalococcoidia bacterium]|jgi:hypothetical protein